MEYMMVKAFPIRVRVRVRVRGYDGVYDGEGLSSGGGAREHAIANRRPEGPCIHAGFDEDPVLVVNLILQLWTL